MYPYFIICLTRANRWQDPDFGPIFPISIHHYAAAVPKYGSILHSVAKANPLYVSCIGRNVQREIWRPAVEAIVIYMGFLSRNNTSHLDCRTFAPDLCVHPL
jgi:hypothetical protein